MPTRPQPRKPRRPRSATGADDHGRTTEAKPSRRRQQELHHRYNRLLFRQLREGEGDGDSGRPSSSCSPSPHRCSPSAPARRLTPETKVRLFIADRRSHRPADASHPLGRARRDASVMITAWGVLQPTRLSPHGPTSRSRSRRARSRRTHGPRRARRRIRSQATPFLGEAWTAHDACGFQRDVGCAPREPTAAHVRAREEARLRTEPGFVVRPLSLLLGSGFVAGSGFLWVVLGRRFGFLVDWFDPPATRLNMAQMSASDDFRPPRCLR